jgi:hypothetical protein
VEKIKNQFYVFNEKEFSDESQFDFIKRINLNKKIVDKTLVYTDWVGLLYKNSEVKFFNIGRTSLS